MVELKVTPEQLANTSQQFETHNQTMKSILNDMMQKVKSLNAQWEGEASTAYITKFSALEADINTISRMVNEHVKDLIEISNTYKTAENNNVSTAGGLPTNTIA